MLWVAVIGVVNLVLVLAARRVVTRLIGLRGAGWRPIFPAYRRAELGQPAVPWWKQLLLVSAGVAASYGLAGCLFATSLKMRGEVSHARGSEVPAVIQVLPDRPAAAAGLRDGDRIVEVAGEPVGAWVDLARLVSQHPGEKIPIVALRDGRRQTFEITPDKLPNGRGVIGVSVKPQVTEVGVGQAIWFGAQRPVVFGYNLVTSLWRLIAGNVDAELGGPVMIIRESHGASERKTAALVHLIGALQTTYGIPIGLLLAFFMRFRHQPPEENLEP